MPVTEIVCIIDRSGSMESIADDAVGGFNAFLESQKALPGRARLSLVLFDHELLFVHDRVELERVGRLDRQTFVPRGATALFDAIGRTVCHITSRLGDDDRVIICILTDGLENASTSFTRQNIFEMIERRREQGWEFVFLAANQDAFAVAKGVSIGRAGTISFDGTGDGVRGAFEGATLIVSGTRGPWNR